jgi:alpha-beta hydrolase superfamily lysophospholipase
MSQSRAIYLQGEHEGLFAMLEAPEVGRARTAVLLCPPFGWDDMCSYRARRDWARALAAEGHAALRLDLPGSGDSDATACAPRLLQAWMRSIDGAAVWLRDAVQAERVTLVGIGLTGLVAAQAALLGEAIDELVLWSVPARGEKLLRELRTFSMLGSARIEGNDAARARREQGDGELEVNGYLLSAETLGELERLDLGELAAHSRDAGGATAAERGDGTAGAASGAGGPTRALLLGRDGMKVDSRLAETLHARGLDVTVAEGPGYGAMMVEPQESKAPEDVFARVGSWLGGASDGPGQVPREGERRCSAHAAATVPHDRGRGWRERAQLEPRSAGGLVRERTLAVPGPHGSLFGVLAEPTGERRPLTALLLNAGPQRRTGPNRMWVEIARRWAASGVATLRIDAAGIGDSDGDASRLVRIAEFYRPEYVAQTCSALDVLAAEGLPPHFVLLGLCGGAYWAAHAALADERVSRVMLLNPRTLVYDPRLHTARRVRELRQRALLASTWRKALSGDLHLARHLETGRTLVKLAATAPRRSRGRSKAAAVPTDPGADPVENLFDQLRERSQRALLMFTGAEVLHRELLRHGTLERMDRWPNVELSVLGTDADTHTLTPLWLQRQVHELLDAALRSDPRAA